MFTRRVWVVLAALVAAIVLMYAWALTTPLLDPISSGSLPLRDLSPAAT